jgi:hypothetical protein
VKRITDTLYEDQYTLLIISHSVILIMKTVSYKVVEHITAPIIYSVKLFFEYLAVYEMMWQNTVQPNRPQYSTIALHAGYLRLQTHWEYLLFTAFHGNSGYTNTTQCNVVRTLPVLFNLRSLRSHVDWNCVSRGVSAAVKYGAKFVPPVFPRPPIC